MSQSRKTRQPDRFMLYMTLMLMLWVVVFVTVLFTQAADPRDSSTPSSPTNTRPNSPNNPFSSGQFANPEDSRFIPRPRRLAPVQLPPARAYTSIVFGDTPFNVDDFGAQQDFNEQQDFDARQDEQTTLATQTNPAESAVRDANSNPADTNPDTSDTETTETTSIDSGDSDNSSDNTDVSNVATTEVTTTNMDAVNTDDITNGAENNGAENIVVNADTDTPRTTSNTSPDAPDTPPTAALELIPDINTSVTRNITTPQDTANDTADDTADDTTDDITPVAQADLASLDGNLSATETPDNETLEDTAADTPTNETSGKAAGALTDTSTPATNEPATNEPATNEPATNESAVDDAITPASNTPFADVRLEPPPLLHPSPATADLITVTFSSQPSGAEVILEDEMIGNTPLELRLPANQDIFYTLAMPSSSSGTSGFRRFSSVVRSSEDTAVAVQLEPISNVPAASIEGFGTIRALRGNRANAQVVRDTVAKLLEQATAEYQAAISDRRIARLQAEIDALEAELARLDAVLATPTEPTD